MALNGGLDAVADASRRLGDGYVEALRAEGAFRRARRRRPQKRQGEGLTPSR